MSQQRLSFSHFLIFLIFIISSFSSFSCKKPQGGTLSVEAQTELEVLAERQWETEQKFHALAEIIARVLEEALTKDDDAAMINHLRDFSSLNEDAVKILQAEIDFWFKHVNKEEKNEFLMGFWPKDYAKSLRKSEAKFFRRTRERPNYAQHFRRVTRPIEMRK